MPKNIRLNIDREPKRFPYGARIEFFLNNDEIQFSLNVRPYYLYVQQHRKLGG